ncbi:MAG: hypothetical protein MZV64_24060 [Ignavibacteriales bacterium]|nr:hypothetical protein [Ignavibacteriales bacterium]
MILPPRNQGAVPAPPTPDSPHPLPPPREACRPVHSPGRGYACQHCPRLRRHARSADAGQRV